MLQFEVRHWITNYEGGFGQPPQNNIDNIFYGSEGYMMVFDGRWQTFLGQKRKPGPSGVARNNPDRDHYQNFIDAIRADDPTILRGNVEEGHYGCALIHLANASYRLGRTLNFDPHHQQCIEDKEADRMLTREYRVPFVVPKEVYAQATVLSRQVA